MTTVYVSLIARTPLRGSPRSGHRTMEDDYDIPAKNLIFKDCPCEKH